MLNEYQKAVVEETESNVCVIACAGSGKTATLIERTNHIVNDLGVVPEKVLCLSFTNTAVNTMKERLQKRSVKLGKVMCTTFHKLAFNICKDDGFRGSNEYEVYKIVEEALVKLRNNIVKHEPEMEGVMYRYLSERFQEVKDKDDFWINYMDEDSLNVFFKRFCSLLEERKIATRSSCMWQAARVLNRNPELKQKYQNVWSFIQADEHQDISSDKWELLKILSEKVNLLVVGDCLQAIYGFAGSKSYILSNMPYTYKDTKVFNLPINYRCSGNIIKLANKVAELSEDSESEFYKPIIADKDNGGKVKYFVRPPRDKLAEIVNQHKGEDIMVMSRTRKMTLSNQSKLFQSGILCNNLSCDKGYGHEVDVLMAYCDLIVGESRFESFKQAVRQPTHYLSNKEMDNFERYCTTKKCDPIDEVSKFFSSSKKARIVTAWAKDVKNLRGRSWRKAKDLADYIVHISDLETYAEQEKKRDENAGLEAKETIEWFIGEAEKFKGSGVEFYKYLMAMLYPATDDKRFVKLATIHKTKGEEYDTVVITHCDENLLPFKRGKYEEEINIFYVAVTRAKDNLYIICENEKGAFSETIEDGIK